MSRKIKIFWKSEKNNECFTCAPMYMYGYYLIQLRRMRNVSDISCRESQNTHFMFNNFLPLIVPLRNSVEKYCRVGLATDDNMAHAYCMLDTWGYKHRLRICNTYSFSTATIVVQTCLNVTLYDIACLVYINNV